MMRLKVLIPRDILIDRDVDKIVAEASNGSFGILPRHVDFVAPLVPGILSFNVGEEEHFVATDRGVLVKAGREVFVSVQRGVYGPDLASLHETVEDHFRSVDSEERAVHQALDRLEADVLRRFVEMHKETHP